MKGGNNDAPTQPPRIVCLGVTAFDYIWHVPSLPAGGVKVRALDWQTGGGGMAATAAVAAARLGATVQYWGRAGLDAAGHAMRAELQDAGVDVRYLRLVAGARSPVAGIIVDAQGERMIAGFPGANLPSEADGLPLDQLAGCAAVLADTRWPEGVQALFSTARAQHIPSVLDAEQADLAHFDALLPLTDYAVFSESALAAYSGGGELRVQLQHARARGARQAAVTLGERGVAWLDAAGLLRVLPAFVVPVVDTNGAGDVFHGALAWALVTQQPWPEALRFASAVAALKCRALGGRAAIPDLATTLAFLQAHPQEDTAP